MATSTGAAVNRYKYGGIELVIGLPLCLSKETRSGLNLYDFIFRLQTPAECSFGSPDPKATSFQWLSPYSFCGANPINNIDQFGDSIQAVSKVSGARLLNVIHTTFDGPKFKDLLRLFKLNRDGMTMQSINPEAFDKAINGLSSDEKALAKAYYLAINSSDMHHIDLCLQDEDLNSKTKKAFNEKRWTSGTEVEYFTGGGINKKTKNGSFTIVIMDSTTGIAYTHNKTKMAYKRYSTPGELVSHELLGHGYGRSIGSPSSRHEDAIQMTNLYWRVRGYNNFYRNGSDHGINNPTLSKSIANEIPKHYR